MTDLEYLDHAESALKSVELACDRINDETDADIDNQRTGGMITLTFANRTQIVINLQKPLQEIWMAAKAGGFHYKFNSVTSVTSPNSPQTPPSTGEVDTGLWLDTRDSSEFFAALSRYASEQSGMPLSFRS